MRLIQNGCFLLLIIYLDYNGNINVLDVVSMINVILLDETVTEYQLWASDLNQDQTTNILDVVSLVNIILN